MRQSLVATSLATSILAFSSAPASAQSTPVVALSPVGGSPTSLFDVTFNPLVTNPNGSVAFGPLSGADFQPSTGILFATGGNSEGGNLYTIDPSVPSATLVGSTGFGTVAGIVFDSDGTLYGSARIGSGLVTTGLVTIDPGTGAATIVGDFGVFQGRTVGGIDGLTIDPLTGKMYGVTGFFHDGSPGDVFEIDKTIGRAGPKVGVLMDASSGALFGAVPSGLTWVDQTLYGCLGGGSIGAAGTGDVFTIDTTAWTYTIQGNVTSGGLTALAHPATGMTGVPDQISVSAGGSQVLSFSAGANFAAKTYVIAGSLSGSVPGLVWAGVSIPLNVDSYTLFTINNPNTPLLNGNQGVLNSSGQATAVLTIPPASDPALAGFIVYHAGVVLDLVSGSLVPVHASNAATCQLVP